MRTASAIQRVVVGDEHVDAGPAGCLRIVDQHVVVGVEDALGVEIEELEIATVPVADLRAETGPAGCARERPAAERVSAARRDRSPGMMIAATTRAALTGILRMRRKLGGERANVDVEHAGDRSSLPGRQLQDDASR